MLRCLTLLTLAACGELPPSVNTEFGLRLVPESMRAIAGQRCVVLVETTLPPTLRSATAAAHADVPFNLVGRHLPGGGAVSEIEVDPDGSRTPVHLFVVGAYKGERASASAAIDVVSGVDELGCEARARLDLFVPYLEEKLPDEGINPDTSWTGAPAQSEATVQRYLFFSVRWEAGLEWQDGRTRLYLRRRFAEARPSMAFLLRSGSAEPVPVSPPRAIDR